jgi:hypothetical protein
MEEIKEISVDEVSAEINTKEERGLRNLSRVTET